MFICSNRSAIRQKGENMDFTMFISGMSCNKCKTSVEKTLNAMDGIGNAKVDLEKGQASFYCETQPSEDALFAAIRSVGFEPTRLVKG